MRYYAYLIINYSHFDPQNPAVLIFFILFSHFLLQFTAIDNHGHAHGTTPNNPAAPKSLLDSKSSTIGGAGLVCFLGVALMNGNQSKKENF